MGWTSAPCYFSRQALHLPKLKSEGKLGQSFSHTLKKPEVGGGWGRESMLWFYEITESYEFLCWEGPINIIHSHSLLLTGLPKSMWLSVFQILLELWQAGCCNHFPAEPSPVISHLHSEKPFPNIHSECPLMQLHFFSLYPK